MTTNVSELERLTGERAALQRRLDEAEGLLRALLNDAPLNDESFDETCGCDDYNDFVPFNDDREPRCKHTDARAFLSRLDDSRGGGK